MFVYQNVYSIATANPFQLFGALVASSKWICDLWKEGISAKTSVTKKPYLQKKTSCEMYMGVSKNNGTSKTPQNDQF